MRHQCCTVNTSLLYLTSDQPGIVFFPTNGRRSLLSEAEREIFVYPLAHHFQSYALIDKYGLNDREETPRTRPHYISPVMQFSMLCTEKP